MKKYKKNILKELMDKNNLSLNDMCEKLNVSQTILKNYMTGKTEPDVKMRKEIRRVLNWEDGFPNLDDSCEHCKDCRNKCKQLFFVKGVFCKNKKK